MCDPTAGRPEIDVDKLNKWLTLIANFAILGGLVFLALEIQQNTNAIRSAGVQAATTVAREHPLMFVQFPEVNHLAMADFESLSEEDRQRRFWLAVSFWHGMQGLYRQAATHPADFVQFVESCKPGYTDILPK